MLTFFTVLVITYSFNGEEVQSRLLYTSEWACSDALKRVEDFVDPDMEIEIAQCQRSDLISRSPRPKMRPWSDK